MPVDHAWISGWPHDRGGPARGEPRGRGRRLAPRLHAVRLPRHRRLVMATGIAGCGNRAAAAACRSVEGRARHAGGRAQFLVEGNRTIRVAAHLGALVVVVCSGPLPHGTLWQSRSGRGRVERRAAVEHGVPGALARHHRYFVWKLISLPSSGRASNTPPAPAAAPKMRELLSVRPSSSVTFVPRNENCQLSPTLAVMPKSQVSYDPSCWSPD